MANIKKFKDFIHKFSVKHFLIFFFAGAGFIAGEFATRIFFPNPQIINVPLASFSNKDTTAILATLEKTVNKNVNIDIKKTFKNVENHIKYLISLVEIQKQELESIKKRNDLTSILITLFGLMGIIIALGAALNFFERFKEKKEDLENEFNVLASKLKKENKEKLKVIKTQSDKSIGEVRSQIGFDMKEARLSIFYEQGVSNYNKGMFIKAISQFLIAYKSNYRKPHTCYYLGSSYKKMYLDDPTQENKANALKYLNEALELNKEESRLTQIQKEIDELNAAD